MAEEAPEEEEVRKIAEGEEELCSKPGVFTVGKHVIATASTTDPPQKQLYKIMGRSRDGCDLLVRYPAFPSTPARSHSMLFPP